MRGRMMEMPLLVSSLIEHAGVVHADQEVVTRTVEGPIHHSTWGSVRRRARRLGHRLGTAGITPGQRIATLGWNTHRHLEVYYAVSGVGAVCHTLNPRLHPSELVWVMNHAEDRMLFVDLTFVPLVEAVIDKLPDVETVVVMTDEEHMPETSIEGALAYETFVAEGEEDFAWPVLDETAAAALCYTSGTTGRPKGVLYSHRSTVLHSLGVSLPDVFDLGRSARCLPIVPMFHACAWGLPYAAAATGTALVMPGPGMDPESLTRLLDDHRVHFCAGVPSVFHGLVGHWRSRGRAPEALSMVLLGGAAPSASLISALEDEFDIEFRHGWGMTETSPLGTVTTLGPEERSLPADERTRLQTRQGRPPFGVELRIVDEEGRPRPHDGEAVGELQVRGLWVVDGYFRQEEDALTEDGWFPTGDVASIDPDGFMRITDRTKDLIKSGGEWISSIDVENLAVGHPGIDSAAVIGVPDEQWGERPVLVAVAATSPPPSRDSVLEHLAGSLAKWQLPDAIHFVETLPMGATGKVQKSRLRETYADIDEGDPSVAG